jgi:serine/threonine-protein kinase
LADFDPKLADDLFREALDLPLSERASFVATQSAGNTTLTDRVMQLLDASDAPDDRFDGLIEQSRRQLLGTLADAGSKEGEDLSGKTIGSWRIEKPLARGGLATVYIAHRDDGQYQQRAAFKVLRRGLDTDDVVARFRAEREILSAMEHSAIAQILDGGTLDDGRPYLVLEFVDGLSITEYCEAAASSVRARVRLTIEVLKALQHAHQHLVVHRDIKPTNIIVSQDGRVTLLDFGIAKLLDSTAMPGGSTLTRTGVFLLTPRYGSPEQHMGNPVTTASDIYQAGGILYELLSGEPPQSGAEITPHTAFSPPSRVVRGTARHAQIKGDLDAIVSKAMQVDPQMRYASAAEMVADLERYLDGKPVLARPDTFFYRTYKLVRRQPLVLPALLVLVLAVGAYILMLNEYTREIRIEQARAEAAQAFMVDLLGSANPYGPSDRERGKEIRVVDALDVGIQRLRSGEYGGDEKLRAALLVPIAGVYENLGQIRTAIGLRQEALELERSLYGETSEPVMLNLRELGHYYRTAGEYTEAGPYYSEQLDIATKLYSHDDPRLAMAQTASGLFEMRRGNVTVATTLLESAVSTLTHHTERYTSEYIEAVVTLARVRVDADIADTLAKLEGSILLADQSFGSDAPLAGLARTQYATSLTYAGRFADAERYFDEAIRTYETRLGRDHGATLIALINLGRLYYAMGDYVNSELVQREVSGHYLRIYGPAHRGVAESNYELGRAIAAQSRLEEAGLHFQTSYDAYLAVVSEVHPDTYRPLLELVGIQIDMGIYADAESNLALAVENLASLTPEHGQFQRAKCLQELLGSVNASKITPGPSASLCPGN